MDGLCGSSNCCAHAVEPGIGTTGVLVVGLDPESVTQSLEALSCVGAESGESVALRCWSSPFEGYRGQRPTQDLRRE